MTKSLNREQIIKILLVNDIKPSLQRISVMQYLDSHRTHPSVDEIYNALSPDMPTLSKTTVYNVLKLLVSKSLIQQLTIDDKKVLFDINTEKHAHFICKRCGKVLDLAMSKNENKTNGTQGFMLDGNYIEETQIYYKGICNECLKKINN